MPRLNIPPTKSNLLSLRRQLAFAEEGYDLLEQKRQILIFELMSRLKRAEEAERAVIEAARKSFAALQQATLDIGSEALDCALLGVKMNPQLRVEQQHIIGIKIPKITATIDPPRTQFGISGTSANTDRAMLKFIELLPFIAEFAALKTAVLQLGRELKKTQRRCNALSKLFVPAYRETIAYIEDALEERERESFIILKMIRNNLSKQPEESVMP